MLCPPVSPVPPAGAAKCACSSCGRDDAFMHEREVLGRWLGLKKVGSTISRMRGVLGEASKEISH